MENKRSFAQLMGNQFNIVSRLFTNEWMHMDQQDEMTPDEKIEYEKETFFNFIYEIIEKNSEYAMRYNSNDYDVSEGSVFKKIYHDQNNDERRDAIMLEYIIDIYLMGPLRMRPLTFGSKGRHVNSYHAHIYDEIDLVSLYLPEYTKTFLNISYMIDKLYFGKSVPVLNRSDKTVTGNDNPNRCLRWTQNIMPEFRFVHMDMAGMELNDMTSILYKAAVEVTLPTKAIEGVAELFMKSSIYSEDIRIPEFNPLSRMHSINIRNSSIVIPIGFDIESISTMLYFIAFASQVLVDAINICPCYVCVDLSKRSLIDTKMDDFFDFGTIKSVPTFDGRGGYILPSHIPTEKEAMDGLKEEEMRKKFEERRQRNIQMIEKRRLVEMEARIPKRELFTKPRVAKKTIKGGSRPMKPRTELSEPVRKGSIQELNESILKEEVLRRSSLKREFEEKQLRNLQKQRDKIEKEKRDKEEELRKLKEEELENRNLVSQLKLLLKDKK